MTPLVKPMASTVRKDAPTTNVIERSSLMVVPTIGALLWLIGVVSEAVVVLCVTELLPPSFVTVVVSGEVELVVIPELVVVVVLVELVVVLVLPVVELELPNCELYAITLDI